MASIPVRHPDGPDGLRLETSKDAGIYLVLESSRFGRREIEPSGDEVDDDARGSAKAGVGERQRPQHRAKLLPAGGEVKQRGGDGRGSCRAPEDAHLLELPE